MKKRLTILISILFLVTLIFNACGSKPEQTEDPTGMKLLTQGNRNFELRNYKEAIEEYTKTLKLLKFKNNREAANKFLNQSYLFLARSAYNNGNYNDAEKYYKLAIEQPEYEMEKSLKVNLHSELGLTYSGKKQLQLALAEFTKSIQIDPQIKLVRYYIGNIYMNQAKYDLAIAEYKKEIAITPDNPEVYNNLGSAFVALNKLQEAIPHFGKAIDLRHNYFRAYQNLANAFTNANDYGQALRVYERLLERNPNVNDAHVYIAEIHMMVGDQKKAQKSLATALEKGYRNWEYLIKDSRGLRTAREYTWFKELVKKYQTQ